jgi:ubiquinone/menaquinone biosynthesis C-methylase UbiE
MARIPETEVMNDPASVDAYTAETYGGGLATFLMYRLPNNTHNLVIADIGCGNMAYATTLKSIFPNSVFTAYDASSLMLEKANLIIDQEKVTLVNSFIPDENLPSQTYDIVLSSLFLHQLPDPAPCWNTIKQIGKTGGTFYVFDLLRVEDSAICTEIVDGMTENAPEVFKTDFYNTLRASFTVEEIQQQLLDAGLVATIQTEEIYPNCSVVYITGTL